MGEVSGPGGHSRHGLEVPALSGMDLEGTGHPGLAPGPRPRDLFPSCVPWVSLRSFRRRVESPP
jgi:hypothetical protein